MPDPRDLRAWKCCRAHYNPLNLPGRGSTGRQTRLACAAAILHPERNALDDDHHQAGHAGRTARKRLGFENRQARDLRQLHRPCSPRRRAVSRHRRLRRHGHPRDQPGADRRARHAVPGREGAGQKPADAARWSRFLDEEIPYLDLPEAPVHDDPVPADHRRLPRACGATCRRTKCRSPGGRARAAMPSGWRRAPSSPTSSARSTRPSWPAAPACRPKRRCTSA